MFSVHTKTKSRRFFGVFSKLKAPFSVHNFPGFVWMAGLTVDIMLRFQIYTAWCGLGLTINSIKFT